ncbi:hypothetical protein CGCSCA4_v010919 [Colletotrichum siamense]|uniref:Uncharacterized protein n=1 Tax=Colletotrichum siamense TaxID=690259 RepID=A0A9P5ES95_COLSI|nr:hypothetical protein CGCSCA4_v010919 [Colletotrichum siamense]KAF4858597.1 hypothetical protein CGCSCA2_v007097 [Colletotrichum siamense]
MDEAEPSPREYARNEGLFISANRHISTRTKAIFDQLQKSPYFPIAATIEDAADLSGLAIPDPVFPPETDFQKGNLDNAVTKIIGIDDEADIMKLALEASYPQRRFATAVSKMELPSLRSDPRHDSKDFSKAISEAKLHDFFRRPNPLVMEPVDEDKDEGLALPKSARHFHDQLARGAEPEEIDYTEEDLTYVAEAVCQEWTNKDLEDLIFLEMSKRDRVQPMTPPLMPPPLVSEPEEEFIPTSEACILEPLSDPDSLIDYDLDTAGKLMDEMTMEKIQPDVDVTEMIGFPSDPPFLHIFPSPQPTQDLKMEVPILCKPEEPPSTSQDEASCRALLDTVPCLGFEDEDVESDSLKEADAKFDKSFSLLLEDRTAELTRMAEQEQIHVADAIARFQPPVVDFSIPEPQWSRIPAKGASEMFRSICLEFDGQRKAPTWPKMRSENIELKWQPFNASLGSVNLKETVGDDRVLQQIFDCRGARLPTSADCVRRESGLKILREDDDEELPMPHYEDDEDLFENGPAIDLLSVIKKRKLAELVGGHDAELESPTVGHKIRRTTKRRIATKDSSGCLLLSENEPNATSKLLDNHLLLHPSNKSRSETMSHFFPTPDRSTRSPTTRARNSEKSLKSPTKLEWQFPSTVAPLPLVLTIEGKIHIVISTTLPRNIMAAIDSLPGIETIDRDFSRYNNTIWSPNSAQLSTTISPLFFEADIIPSPATGIIITTILQVGQKAPLNSGQHMSKLRERVTKVAPRYQRLIIMVSESSSEEYVGPLGKSNVDSYNSFVGFASGVGISTDCVIRVIYIGGGPKTLETWTCALVSTYVKENIATARYMLMMDETEWEVFFRHVGLNVYAAQLIISLFRGCFGPKEKEPLVRFFRMPAAQKAQVFGRYLGERGHDVLNRVGARLEYDSTPSRKPTNPSAAVAAPFGRI